MKQTHYLKALSSVTYGKDGVTMIGGHFFYQPIDLQKLLGKNIAVDLAWLPQFGWSNQPDVLCFSHENVALLDELIGEELYDLGLMIRSIDW